MKALLIAARWIVGLLFIFSGLIKANDPLGLSYKMEEFFEVWAAGGFLPGMMNFLHAYALQLSLVMIAFEIIAGVAVLLGWKMNLFSWLLLLLIIFFSFLTGYALFSGKIRTCGCFGDCIPLSAAQSFTKDIILLLLIGFIFLNRRKITPAFSNPVSVAVLTLTTIFSFWAQAHVLNYLPVLDCLPYKVGKSIPDGMRIPQGAIPDSTVISFVYNKEGKEIEFTSDKFPTDFNDSVYHFVKRYDKLVRKGNAEPAIRDFSLKAIDGGDSTDAILKRPGYTLLYLTIDKGGEFPEFRGSNQLGELIQQGLRKGFGVYAVTNNLEKLSAIFQQSKWNIPILQCDAVALKTAARSGATVYLLKSGTILNKWSYLESGEAIKTIQELNP